MQKHRIVIDTNVLVAALRSRRGASFKLLRLIGRGHFTICISIPLVLEYEDVLARNTIGIPTDAAQDILDYLCQVSLHQEVFFLWRPFLKDPKDDLVLELAVASQSEYIVTYNIKDFRTIEQFGIHPVRPAGFLAKIRS
jgi:putative PIN family toxin of toxin-antitoxin system